MSEELKAAQARITCLEGEIAKRDAELAACRVAVENCELFRARIAELEHRCGMYGLELTNEVERRLQAERQLSALKAQGVVMPEPDFWLDGGATPCYYAEPLRAVLNAAPAAPAADASPENCRQRLASEGKPYPKSSCAACGQFSPKWRECDAALAAHRAKGVV